jgi:hypothetical protein
MVFRNFQGHLCRVAREVMQLGVLWIALGTGRKSSPVAYLMVGQRVDRREDLPSAEQQNQSDCQRRVVAAAGASINLGVHSVNREQTVSCTHQREGTLTERLSGGHSETPSNNLAFVQQYLGAHSQLCLLKKHVRGAHGCCDCDRQLPGASSPQAPTENCGEDREQSHHAIERQQRQGEAQSTLPRV